MVDRTSTQNGRPVEAAFAIEANPALRLCSSRNMARLPGVATFKAKSRTIWGEMAGGSILAATCQLTV